MGFNDLATPALDLPEVAQLAQQAPAAGSSRKAKKAAKEAAAAAGVADMVLLSQTAAAAAAAAFDATCTAALSELAELEAAQGSAHADVSNSNNAVQLGGKYAGQLPRLTRRFQNVLQTAGAAAAEAGAEPGEGWELLG